MKTIKPEVNLQRMMISFKEQIEWPEGTPTHIRKYLDEIERKYSFLETLEIESEWVGYEDCIYNVIGQRLETDSEFESRVERERLRLKEWEEAESKKEAERQKQADSLRRKEIAELNRLLKKYKEGTKSE